MRRHFCVVCWLLSNRCSIIIFDSGRISIMSSVYIYTVCVYCVCVCVSIPTHCILILDVTLINLSNFSALPAGSQGFLHVPV